MKNRCFSRALTLAAAATTLVFAQTTPKITVDIPFQKFVLPNGLTLIVHEDHKAPIVAVNVWYHVGSKNEKVGKTGFAHLYEHLMFNGSEHYNTDIFQAFERLGATDTNGTTNNDRTNYFTNVPTSGLDQILWLESDRMGFMLAAIDKARLDEQRGVVQNEKRQGENQPYGITEELIVKNVWPAAHPYSWTVIGSMDDLSAASLDDVKEWFKTYYGAANATLVIAGDIDAKTAKAKVEKYFGAIPSGPPVAHQQAWIAKRTGTQRQVAQDRVPAPRIYKVWNVPEFGSQENEHLDLAASILGAGRTSRLYKRLVFQDQIATDVQVNNETSQIAGTFNIVGSARNGIALEKVEKAIDEELARFLKDGPTADELQIAKTRAFSGFLRGAERIGGFGGKSDLLAIGQVYGGDPAFYKKQLNWTQAATTDEVRATAQKWLSDGVFNLEVQPFPEFTTSSKDADRSKLPEAGVTPAFKMPKLERSKLSNGIQVVLAERHDLPLVNVKLMVDAGYSADQFATPGTSNLSVKMMLDGTAKRTALQISEESARLGATLGTNSNLDFSAVNVSALKSNLDATLELFSDVVLNPAYPAADVERQKQQQIAAIQRERMSPMGAALRVMPVKIYGAGHAYGQPLSGSGTEESVGKMDRGMLAKFHATWFKPNNATILIVGDTTLAEITPKLEKLFAGWKGGEVPKKNLAEVKQKEKPVVYLIDRPGAQQTNVLAGNIAPPKSHPADLSLYTFDQILGGTFTSRMNMNLREDKHWSYGSQTYYPSTRGQRPFMVIAPVQTDKTKEAIVEIQKELRGISKDKSATAEELLKIQQSEVRSQAGSRETSNALLGAMEELVRFQLPQDYFDTYAPRIEALTLKDMSAASETLLRPEQMTWVIVGDLSKIEAGVRSLNLGEIQKVDGDGNPVK